MKIKRFYSPWSLKRQYFLGVVLVLLGAVGFSVKGILIKLAYQQSIPALPLLTLRLLFSAPFYALGLLFYLPSVQKISFLQSVRLFIVGLLGYYVASILDFMGLAYVTASIERLLLFLYPTFVLLINALVYKKRIFWNQYIALFLSYVGIFIALFGNLETGVSKNLWVGGGLVLMSAFSYSIYVVESQDFIQKIGPVIFTSIAMLVATLGTTVHFSLFYSFVELGNYSEGIYKIVILMAIFSTVVPTFMVAEGIRLIGSNNASIISSVGPVVSIVFSYWILNENFTLIQAFGTALVVVGVLFISKK